MPDIPSITSTLGNAFRDGFKKESPFLSLTLKNAAASRVLVTGGSAAVGALAGGAIGAVNGQGTDTKGKDGKRKSGGRHIGRDMIEGAIVGGSAGLIGPELVRHGNFLSVRSGLNGFKAGRLSNIESFQELSKKAGGPQNLADKLFAESVAKVRNESPVEADHTEFLARYMKLVRMHFESEFE